MQNSLNLTEKFIMKFTINSLNTKVANTFTELLTIYCLLFVSNSWSSFCLQTIGPFLEAYLSQKSPKNPAKLKTINKFPECHIVGVERVQINWYNEH